MFGAGRPSWRTGAVGALLCAGLVIGGVTPSSAGESSGAGTPALGSLPMGAGVQGVVDERSGGFSFQVPAGQIVWEWDSRRAGADRLGLGFGWSIAGVGFVERQGGVRVVPSRGSLGGFEASASVPSGLAGYEGHDIRFSQTPGTLPARADGLVGEQAYAFVLRELGGLVSYFDAAGDPIAKLDANGTRTDWTWHDGHRLDRIVSGTGVVTALDWSDPGRVEIETRIGPDGPVRPSSVVELDGGRVAAMTDASGARTSVGYTDSGLASRVLTATGAGTAVSWQTLADGTPAAAGVVVTDQATGERVTERRWKPIEGLASGWPTSSGGEYRTSVADGTNRVVSTYDPSRGMTARETILGTPSGDHVVQRQAFSYPDRDDGAPVRADRPTGMDLTLANRAGAARTLSERYVFDDLGRLTERSAADGSIMRTEYDDELPDAPTVPAELTVPIGLPVRERTEAPDGSVTEFRYTLNEARTAITVAETFTGSTTGGASTRTSRTEYVVDADGFVTLERVFGQGGEGTPLVTEHTKDFDLGAGTVTTTDTIAAGTDLAATTTTVTDLVHGQPTETTDVLGNTTTMTYDAAGRPLEVTEPGGDTATAGYRTWQQHGGNATILTTSDRISVTEEQDVLGRTIRILDNIRDGVATDGYARVAGTREYPAPGIVATTDAWGWTTTTEHDPLGRVARSTLASGLSQVVEYDDVAGTRSSGATATGDLADAELVLSQQVDVQGRITGTSGVRADGIPVIPTVTEFDGFGRQTRAADGVTDTAVEYDLHGNPVTTTIDPIRDADAAAATGEPRGNAIVATRRFDERGASVEKTLTAAGESRTGGAWEHDLLGREIEVTDQAGAAAWYAYTLDGLVDRRETAAGAVTVHTYDPVSRRLTETVTTSPIGESVRTGFEYDETTGRTIAVFDPADRDATAIRYAYDAWGNTTEIAYPDDRSIRHTYDPHGRIVSTTDIAGRTTTYTHDRAGLLLRAVQRSPEGSEGATASVSYAYDEYGRVTGIERGNGVRTEITFTSASEIASETTTGPDGAVQSKRTYTYDPHGDLIARADTTTPPGADEPATTTTAYTYDVHHRLVSSTVHDGETPHSPARTRTEYTVNVSGDVTREQTTANPGAPEAAVTARSFEYGPTGRLEQISTTAPDGRTATATQEYDDAGNLTLAADGTRYAYNAANQTVQETTPAGAVISTGYWATGDRAWLATGTHTTGFYWDDGTLLNDTHTTSDSTQTASYLTALTRESRTLTEPVDRVAKRIEITIDEGARVSRPTTTYATHDRHGSTTELTTETGTQSTSYTYTDYGTTTFSTSDTEPAPTETSRYPFLYAGEYTNPTGTQHLVLRTYNPASMSFTSLDLEFLQNRYGYANANPITNIDPSGRFAIHDFINGLTIGLAVAFTAITVAGTWGMAAPLTGWGLFAAGSALVGMGANIGGTTIAVMRLVNDHGEKFLEPADDERMTHAEYAFMAIGLLGSLGAAAPKMFGRSMAKSTSVRPPTKQEPSPVASTAEHVTQPTALDTSVPTSHVRGGEVVSVTSDPAGPNWAAREAGLPVVAPQLVKSDLVRSYMGGRSGALREMRSTAAYKTHRKLNPDSNVVSTVGKAKAGLRSLMTSYTQRVSGREAQIMSDQEVASFLTEHRDTILGIEHAISSARSEIIGGLKKLAIASPGAAGSMVRRLNEKSPGLQHAGFPEVARLFAK